MSWVENKKFEQFSDELMPGMGNCKTVEGEVIRATSKIVYRYFNDGDKFYYGYGIETCGSAHAFLTTKCPISEELEEILSKMEQAGDELYEKGLQELVDKVADWVDSKNGNYTPNTEDLDMLEFEPLFEEDEYWDDYDDYWEDEY